MVARTITEKATKQLLIVLFIGIGITLTGARWLYFGADPVLPEDTAWKISLKGQIEVNDNVTFIYTGRPKAGRYHKLISQRFYHPGLKILAARPGEKDSTRMKATTSGVIDLLVEYHIQVRPTPKPQLSDKPALSAEKRALYLSSNESMDITLPALAIVSDQFQRDATNKPQLLHKIFQHSQKLLKVKNKHFDKIQTAIESNKATTLGRARLMVTLCRASSIPARLVTGFILEEDSPNSPYYWVEVYDEDKHWLPYDPEKGYEAQVPAKYVGFRYDEPDVFTIDYGKLTAAKFSVSEDIEILSLARSDQEEKIFDIFDLRRLDLDTRQTLTKLLVLPICILLTAFFRHVLGLYPYGVFTAPLLALAMVYAEPFITMIISAVVIFLALLGRSILPKTLSRSPRLSLVFTFVAISMAFSVSLLSYFSINPGGSIILIPTIILASMVDRFYSYMDESGPHAALLRLGVTVLIAIICIPILINENLGALLLAYPEIHLITAALVLMLSQYKGIKVTDYKYFKLLGENRSQKST